MSNGNINSVGDAIKNVTKALREFQAEMAKVTSSNGASGAFNDLNRSASSVISTIGKVGQTVNSTVNKVVSTIRSILSTVKTVFNSSLSIVTGFKSGIEKIVSIFGSLGNRVKSLFTGMHDSTKSAGDSVNILSGTFTELKSKIDLISSAISKLFNNDFTNSALNLYQSIYSFKNIVGTELTQSTIDWGNSMERVLGLSARHMIADLNELSGTIYGLGIAASDVPVASENILMVSRYLATMGAAGGDATAVMTKLQSALAGIPRSAYSLGIRLDVGQLNQYLKGLKAMGGEYANISTNFSELNTEAQSYIRYSALISQFSNKYDIKTFADALDTTTGRITQLKEAIYNMKTVIGQAVIEAFGKIANFVTYIVNFITAQVQKIAQFFHIDMDFSADTNSSGKAFEVLGDTAEDTANRIEDIEKATKKAKKSLFGFDKVTKLSSNNNSTDSSSVSDGFDYSKLFNSALDSLDDLEGKTKSLDERIKEQLDNWKKSLKEFAVEKTGRIDFDLGFDWSKIQANLKQVLDNIKSFTSKWGNFAIEIGLKFLDDINIGVISTKFSELLSKFTDVANTVSAILIPAFRKLYDETLKPIVEWAGIKIAEAIDYCILKLGEFSNWFVDNKDTISNFITDSLPNGIKELGARLSEAFNALFKGNISLDTVVTVSQLEYGDSWIKFLNVLYEINSIGSSVADIISGLAKSFGSFLKEEGLPWLNEQLEKFSGWLATHKKNIEDILTKIGSFAWEGFKGFVDIVGKLVNFAVENPDTVVNMFKGLIALKVGSWFATTAAGIGETALKLKALTAMKNLPSTLSALTGAGSAATAAGAIGAVGSGLNDLDGYDDLFDYWYAKRMPDFATLGQGFGAAALPDFATLGEGFTATAGAGAGISVGAIAGITAAVVALALAFKDLWDNCESFRAKFEEMGERIASAWQSVTDRFSKTSELGQKFTELGNKLSEIGDKLYSIWEKIRPVFDLLFTAIGEGLTGLIEGVLTGLGTFIDSIINIISGIADTILGILNLDLGQLIDGITAIIDGIAGSLFSVLDIAITTLINWIGSIGENIVAGFKDGIDKAWQGIKEWVTGLFDSFIGWIKDILGIHSPSTVFSDIGGFLIEGLKNGITTAFNGLLESAQNLMNNLVDKFREAKDKALNIWDGAKDEFKKVVDKIGEVFSGIKDGIANAFTKAKNGAIEIWNNVTGQGSQSRTVQAKAPMSARSIQLTEFAGFRAGGGSIPKGSTVIANEGGRLEMIGKVPGGQSVVANNQMITEQIYKAVSQAMIDALSRVNFNQGGGDVVIKNEGIAIYDEATLRTLKRKLNEID